MDWDPTATSTDGYVCPPCPVFYPTEQEFQHPLKYISSIRHIGVQAGICKIVPPAGWQPPFAINEKTFRFRTRVQQLNCIDGHTRAEGNFVEMLRMFLYRNGTPMQELPRVDGGSQLLNLHLLFKTVVEFGGYEVVTEGNLWSQVVRRIGRTRASDRPSQALCAQYQKHYETCLLQYEKHHLESHGNGEGKKVFQTPDVTKQKNKTDSVSTTSIGGVASEATTTPSAKTRSSMKKQRRADDAEEARVAGAGGGHQDEGEDGSPSAKRVKRTLFSDGGHTSSEDSDCLMDGKTEPKVSKTTTQAGAVASTRKQGKEEHDELDDVEEGEEDGEEEEDGQQKKQHKPQQPTKSAAELEPIALKPNSKRKHRLEAPEICIGQKFYHFLPAHGGAKIGEVQRIVKGKKPHVFVKYPCDGTRETIGLSTMQLIIANGWDPEAAEVAFKSELCQTCLRGDCWDQLLLCDSCNGGHHLFCLDTPLVSVPNGDWYCDTCVHESLHPTKDANPKFGFEMGSEYTLETYKEKADNWKRTYFGTASDLETEQISDRDLEREYWRILSTPLHEQRLEVEYGSDIDSGSVGSGFPRSDDLMKSLKVLAKRMRILSARKGATATQKKLCELFSRGLPKDLDLAAMEEMLEKYASDDWNLNNLPKMSGSVLQHLDEDIKGVMVPWIYIGMCFSTFCWHVEDHNFYSISYLHRGAPKTWYGVPCGKAEFFESVMKKLTPELFGSQPDLHLQLVTMFSPETLIQHNVPVYRATHNANEFIVTFPSAYHGGFNNGFNCAEAVNFATVDWIPWGAKSVRNYRNFGKLPVFAHEALVVSLAETLLETHSFQYETTKAYLLPAVQQLVNDREAFEETLSVNKVTRRESMAEYARRHGLTDADTSAVAAAGGAGGNGSMGTGMVTSGPYARSCKMAAKAVLSPEKKQAADDTVSGGMKQRMRAKMSSVRAPGKMQAGPTTMATARPTRMVLWAGNSGKSEGLRCSTCKQYCYLEAVVCTKCRHHSSVGCMDHYPSMCKCNAEDFYLFLYRYDRDHLPGILAGMEARVKPVEDWLFDWHATFDETANHATKSPVVIAKKLLAAGLQCGGAPQDKLDELEDAISEAMKWTATAERLMSSSSEQTTTATTQVLVDLACLVEDGQRRLRLHPDGLNRVEDFLGEWTTCKVDAERLVAIVGDVQHAETLSSAFDFHKESQDVEALWVENDHHLRTMRQLVDVADRAQSLGRPLPLELGDRVHAGNQFLRALIAANEMLAVIARFTRAKATSNARSTPPSTPKPADVAVIMESDCRHVIVQADVLERNRQLPIFKVKILRSLLRVTEVEAQELQYALNDSTKSFEELDAIWRRLRGLPICPDRLDELGKRLSLCKSWEQRGKQLLDGLAPPSSSSSSAFHARQEISWDDVLARPSLDEAQRFYDEADRHFVPASSLVRRQVHTRLQDCRRWYAAMHALFVRAPPVTSSTTTTESGSSLQLFLRGALDKIATPSSSGNTWQQELHCICDQVLSDRATLVHCVDCQRLFHSQCVGHEALAASCFLCLECRSPPPASGHRTHRRSSNAALSTYPPPPYPLFCSCRGPEDMSMICCDLCDEWYHSSCIGMTTEEMNHVEAYRCARCAVKQNLYYLDKKALKRNALGRRPAVGRVETLLVQLQTSIVALPLGTHELLQYLRHVKDVETRVQSYVGGFAAEFSVASFSSLDYRAEEHKVLALMQELTGLEVHLESAIGNLSAIHWSLRACELVLSCENGAPHYSHLVVLLDDAKQPQFVFPRDEYRHIQQTIEDRVVRAAQWLKQAKTLEVEEWNTERARRLVNEYDDDLAQFLQLPAHEVELVFRVAGEQQPRSSSRPHQQHQHPPESYDSSTVAGHICEERVVQEKGEE